MSKAISQVPQDSLALYALCLEHHFPLPSILNACTVHTHRSIFGKRDILQWITRRTLVLCAEEET